MYDAHTVTIQRGPKRGKMIQVRLTAPEWRNLRAMARRAGLTDSAFLRRCLEVHSKIEHALERGAIAAASAAVAKDAQGALPL